MGFARRVKNKVIRLVEGPPVRERTLVKVVRDEDRPRLPAGFVAGVYRSGTTLLRYILDSHSQIAVPPESNFLSALAGMYGSDWHRKGLQAVGVDQQALLLRLGEFSRNIYDDYAVAKGKRRWIDKTPAYVEILDFLALLFGAEARFIMLYRHGFDVANSLAEVAANGTMFADADKRYEAAYRESPRLAYTQYWAEMCERMLAFEESHPQQCFRLHYEDFAADPKRFLPPLFDFIGESWEPEVLKFAAKSHDFGLQDHKILETKGFKPSLRNYDSWSASEMEKARSVATPILERLGYVA